MTTKEVCTLFLTLLSISSVVNAANLVCYFPNWSTYRAGIWQYNTTNVNPTLCTHYLYAFAVLDSSTMAINPSDPWADISLNGFANFVALKNKNPSAKFLISVGGASDSGPKYSTLVSSTTNINKFVSSAVSFLKSYKFDGLDFDWECPSSPADKAGFSNLMIALKTAFKPYGYLLSAAVPVYPPTIDAGYNIPVLNQYLDMVNLMTYDYHGASWERTVANHHSPLRNSSTDKSILNSDYSVNYWISKGMSPSKINMGVPIYGASWVLTSSVTAPPAPANGPGVAGPETAQPGTLGYNEICSFVLNNGWKVTQDPTFAIGPYAVSPSSPKTWVGYDDPVMAKVKANYIMSKGLGGGMVWDISMDDFRGLCKGGTNPLLSALSTVLVGSSPTTPAPTSTSTVTSSTSSKPTTLRTSTASTSRRTTTTATSTMKPISTTPSKIFVCPTPNGLFPDPTSCTTFYSCGNGVAFKLSCTAGLYFNPSLSVCDWPENVKCSVIG